MVFLGVDLVLSIFTPWSFILFRLWSIVLFLSASALGWEVCPQLWFATLGFLSFSLFLIVFRLPVWAGFLFIHCCCLSPLRFSLLSPLPVSVLIYLVYGAVAVCFTLFFLVYDLCFTAGRGLLASSPSPPFMLQLQFFQPHWAAAPGFINYPLWSVVSMAIAPDLQSLNGRCFWLTHLCPLFRCVHGIASLACSHIVC